MAELTALRNQLKRSLSGDGRDAEVDSASGLAKTIKDLKAGQTIDSSPQRLGQVRLSAEVPVTARIRRKLGAGAGFRENRHAVVREASEFLLHPWPRRGELVGRLSQAGPWPFMWRPLEAPSVAKNTASVPWDGGMGAQVWRWRCGAGHGRGLRAIRPKQPTKSVESASACRTDAGMTAHWDVP